jgi:lysophospholipase L1-like esterase
MNQEQMMQLLAAMNPELAPILALMMSNSEEVEDKPKRKPSAYNRRYAAAYRRIKKKHMLKNGNMAKGWSGKRGHARIVKMAHAEAKKGGRRR